MSKPSALIKKTLYIRTTKQHAIHLTQEHNKRNIPKIYGQREEKEEEKKRILLRSTKCNLVGQHVTKRLTTPYDHIFIIILLTEQTSPKTSKVFFSFLSFFFFISVVLFMRVQRRLRLDRAINIIYSCINKYTTENNNTKKKKENANKSLKIQIP